MSKLIFTSYSNVPGYRDPHLWLQRIKGYTGILEQLAKDHEVIGIEHINYQGTLRQNEVQYYFSKLEGRSRRFPFRLHQLIKSLDPDVVFINGFIFPLQVIQLKMILGKSRKIVILHRAEKPFSGIKKRFQQLADKCVDAYLFTSSGFDKQWENNINIKKIHEIIQGSSVFHFSDRAENRKKTRTEGSPVYLWVGALTARKDPLTVIHSFLEFARHHPQAKLYMIFQSDELLTEILFLLHEHPQSNSIILLGHIAHERLGRWFNSADFFITASHYEGSGVALSEAMSCGCIPITSTFISFKKMTGEGRCGLSFETGNSEDLTRQLLKSVHLNLEAEKEKVLQQFNHELSFAAIAKKINYLISPARQA